MALGGCGIFFGSQHPYSTATPVTGRKLDSYRAELHYVRLTLSGCHRWQEKIWVTLDNQAVVNDLNRCIDNQGKFCKEDNSDIWESIAKHFKKRAARAAIRITWAKSHAKEEHIAAGKTTEVEMHRNREADKLATEATGKNATDSVVIKSTKQRKRMALIQQTMLVKI